MKILRISFLLPILLISSQLFSLSIMDVLYPHKMLNNEINLNSDLYDYYYYKNDDGKKQFCFANSFTFRSNFSDNFPNKYLYGWKRTTLFVNSINTINDDILLVSDKYSFQVESKLEKVNYSLSAQHYKNYFNYDIDFFSGRIPLSFNYLASSAENRFGKIRLGTLFGNNHKNDFDNSLSGFLIGTESQFSFINFRLDYLFIKADLKKDGDQFCKLNGINLFHYSLGTKYHNFSTGISGVNIWQNNRSYLDAEPFISYYSLFFGSKTFIKKLDSNLFMPYIAYENKKIFRNFLLILNLDYYHIFLNTDIIYTERIWLIPGIYPNDSTQHHYHTDLDADAILQIKLNSDFDYKFLNISVLLSQVIPIDYSHSDGSSAGTSSNKIVHGGFYLSLNIGYNF